MEKPRNLNQSEIEAVLLQAEEYGCFLDLQNLSFQCNVWTDICFLSPRNKMIFISGNEKTGFRHISQRHLFYQGILHWKGKKPDHPSVFMRGTIPFGDYRAIADELYSEGEKNKSKRLHFDNYLEYIKSRCRSSLKI